MAATSEQAMRDAQTRVTPRHPAEVTSDRLADHYERYYEKLTRNEREAITDVRWALQQIAEGER